MTPVHDFDRSKADSLKFAGTKRSYVGAGENHRSVRGLPHCPKALKQASLFSCNRRVIEYLEIDTVHDLFVANNIADSLSGTYPALSSIHQLR